MTNPNLAIATSLCSKTRADAGRQYQRPGTANPFPAKIRYSVALEGILAGLLCPSITTIIGAAGPDLQGWATYMSQKSIMDEVRSPAFWEFIQFNGAVRGGHRALAQTIKEIATRGQHAAKNYTEFTAERGTAVHAHAENYLIDGTEPTEFPYDEAGYYQGFKAFMRDTNPEVESVECTVYGETEPGFSYAGTMDAVLRINGKRYAVDWKTSKTMSKTVAIQLAAGVYATERATEDESGVEPNLTGFDGAMGVQLHPDGRYTIHLVQNLEHHWIQFIHLRRVWQWKAFNGAIGGEFPLVTVDASDLP